MAQTLSAIPAAIKLKAVGALAEAFEIWTHFDLLTSYLANTAPEKDTRDAAILALTTCVRESPDGYCQDWDSYESTILQSRHADPTLVLGAIEVLTRTTDR